jgi:hypothetical protein
VLVRGALIGGGVGAVLAAVRNRGADEAGRVSRFVRSIAEGAAAGAAVAFLVARRNAA